MVDLGSREDGEAFGVSSIGKRRLRCQWLHGRKTGWPAMLRVVLILKIMTIPQERLRI